MLQSSLLLQIILLVLIDIYIYTSIYRTTRNFTPVFRLTIRAGIWLLTATAITAVVWYNVSDPYYHAMSIRQWVITVVIMIYISKILTLLVIFIDDIQINIRRLIRYFRTRAGNRIPGKPITRSEFFDRTAIAVGFVPFASMVAGIVSGANDYRVVKKTVHLPNLPRSFDGIRIGQFSDIHAGTFFNKIAVRGGVEMLMNEKPDVIFFTGDLVNYQTDEVDDYISIFNKVRAPMGVFSSTGNHDYGNYRSWPTAEAKRKNLEDLFEAHRLLGYDLLMNEHRFLDAGGDRIAIIGVENWGVGPPMRFPKYGNLARAHKGTEEAPVRILLSHDPSHWDAQIRPEFHDVDLTFAGHTHGFQMGIEIGNFRWSPSQYVYKQWADLYRQGSQYLYVNRGFGCIGYPGRVGMPPELTIIELKRAVLQA
ncbi:MAG TPA: metallophosphoesterase [Chryseosolibacter sp.]